MQFPWSIPGLVLTLALCKLSVPNLSNLMTAYTTLQEKNLNLLL